MAFRFTLRSVLRFRESFEQRECQRLQAVNREVGRVQQQREEAILDRVNAQNQLTMKMRTGMTAMEMQFELACDRARVRRITSINDQAVKLDVLRRRQLELFQKAQQQRKILENLRDRQLADYRLIENRREQQRLDEGFLLTHPSTLSGS